MPPLQRQEIACQQVLVDDASVFSIQWSTLPAAMAAGLTAESLLDRYLMYIRRCTAGIITPHRSPTGIEFRLLGSRVSLISFAPPELAPGSCDLHICGGLLVSPQMCHRGQLRFALEPAAEGIRVILQLSDYCPLLLGTRPDSLIRRWTYRLTQALIHRLVTVRFLVLLYRELTGGRIPVTVVRVNVRDGRPI